MPESAPGASIESSEPQGTNEIVNENAPMPEQHTEQALVEAKASEVQAAEADRLAEINRQFEAIGDAIGPIEKSEPQTEKNTEPIIVGRPVVPEESGPVEAEVTSEPKVEPEPTSGIEASNTQEISKPVDTPILEVTEEPEQKEVVKQEERVETLDSQSGEVEPTIENQVETQPKKSPEQLQVELAQEQQRIASLRQQIQQVEHVPNDDNLAERLAKEAEEMTQKLNPNPTPASTGSTFNPESAALADFEKQRAMLLSSFQTAIKANELKKAA